MITEPGAAELADLIINAREQAGTPEKALLESLQRFATQFISTRMQSSESSLEMSVAEKGLAVPEAECAVPVLTPAGVRVEYLKSTELPLQYFAGDLTDGGGFLSKLKNCLVRRYLSRKEALSSAARMHSQELVLLLHLEHG